MQEVIGTGAAAKPEGERPSEKRLLNWQGAEAGTSSPFVIACVDHCNMDVAVVAHAQALAGRLQAQLILTQVLEPATHTDGPQDPVSWGSKRHRCRERFEWLARQHSFKDRPEQVLLEGRAATEIAALAATKGSPFLALATRGDPRSSGPGLGSTVQKILEGAHASLLLIPPTSTAQPTYERILVPLDGSCRAESALPTVVAMAKEHRAEVLLIHVVPQPQFIQLGPLEPEAVALRDNVVQRNEQVARTYMERVLHSLRSSEIDARPLLVHGDARGQLHRTVLKEGVDLIIMATHGQSGRADMPLGSVARYLADHLMTPMLILRSDDDRSTSLGAIPYQEHGSVFFRQ